MNLLLIGVNHRTATLDDREALALGPSEAFTVLRSLIDGGAVSEAALLSTCNRTEFYVVAADADAGEHAVRDVVVRARHRDLLTPGSNRYEFRDHAAAAHLFRVACSLDSLVLGDVQILGQVKNAYQIARRAGATGWLLDRLFETALHAGKRSRAETGIGTGSVSVPSAAVARAADVCGPLEGRHVLIVGAGETARLAATAAHRHHPASMVIVNRTEARAVSLSAEVGARARPLDGLADALADADVVFSATRARTAVISADAVAHAMTWRRERRLLLFDLAVPRDIDPAVSRIPAVELHSVESIRNAADEHRLSRIADVPSVEQIVAEETERFAAWARSRAATPTVIALRDHFERIRVEELERLLARAPEAERSRADKLTRALVNRLLHVPTLCLKDADASSDDGRRRLRAAEDLFAIGAPSGARPPRHDA